MRNLLIDDMRNPGEGIIPTDCVVIRNYWEGLRYLENVFIDCLYLDHDLGCFAEGREFTGYDLLCELERFPLSYIHPKEIKLVTSNPVGRARMEQVIRKLYE
jgi:hypothetical protein